MPVIANPLPIRVPRRTGTDRTDRAAITRLWDAVDDIANLVRAVLDGRLFEWHVDEFVDKNTVLIPHGLKRVPVGVLAYRLDSGGEYPQIVPGRTDTTVVALRINSNDTIMSFILF